MAKPALRLLAIPLAVAALLGAPLTMARDVPAANQAAESGYLLPPAELRAIVDAPSAPQMTLSPRRDLIAFVETPSLPGIDVVAQPELRLAGTRINPRTYSQSRFSFGTGLSLQRVDGGAEQPVQGLPQPLALASMAWSPDQRHIAFTRVDARAGRVELWIVDVAAARARRLIEQPLNTVVGSGFEWLPDSQGLLVQLRPEGQGEPPADAGIPAGPNIQETAGGGVVQSLRTFQDLLRNPHDEAVFAHFLTTQIARVDLRGGVTPVGAPDLHVGMAVSPDGRHILLQRLERPFSYLVPYSRFPRVIDVVALDGRVVHTVARLPLVEGLPTGNDAVATGVRRIAWRADAPATLVWAEAQDGGDPSVQTDVRDRVYMHAAPFRGEPRVLAELSMRYAGAAWGNGELALLNEYWWRTRQIREWRLAPDGDRAPQLIREGSYEDRYADPGSPVMQAVRDHAERGVNILGVCNGFQILTESGLLPGVLMRNASLKFVCREVSLSVENADTAFTRGYSAGQIIRCPVAHHDGNYFADPETLAALEGNGQVAFRYAGGTNPNGSINDIAGILNSRKNILGLMPHPENLIEAAHGGIDGERLFSGVMQAA